MNKKLKFLSITIILTLALIFFLFPHSKGRGNLINPATPTPGPRPKTFIFDASTDLKKELDSINPQILDSDFE